VPEARQALGGGPPAGSTPLAAIISSRLAIGQLEKGMARHVAQTIQGNVSLLHALQELLRDTLTAFMVAAMRNFSTNLFENDVHVCLCVHRSCPCQISCMPELILGIPIDWREPQATPFNFLAKFFGVLLHAVTR
jgi:hypothetical protein